MLTSVTIVLYFLLAINDGVFMENHQAPSVGGDLDWWKHAVFYQIYPRSFKDDNNDGIGDLPGVLSKLNHFPETGVTAIWLSPIFQSPQVDQGYDISNYTAIEPDYGTLDDLRALIVEAHNLGIKVILDFVPNHTSDQHQWFIDSVNNVEEYRDYYLWANAVIDENGQRQPPNNWISNFKNSAWTWSDERQQYYLHQFASAQPDLNYRNPKVLQAMTDILGYWLDHGVDGFRVDAVPYLFEDEELRDEPPSGQPGYTEMDYEYLNHTYTKDLQGTFEVIYHWREFVDNYTKQHGGDQRVLMTEAYTTQENTARYYGAHDGSRLGSHFSFNFLLITDIKNTSTAHDIANTLNGWLNLLPDIYTPNWVIGNHDNRRVASRFGSDNVDGLNMMTSMMPGIAVTYNGEEIGQEDGEVSYDEGQDPSARDPAIFEQLSRDFERTPYQWDDTVNAGFNLGAKPWLPVGQKYLETNLAKEKTVDGPSHYKVYQALMKLRSSDVLRDGDVEISAINDGVLLVKRTLGDSSLALIFNFGNQEENVDLQSSISDDNTVVLTSINSSRNLGDIVDPATVALRPHESIILEF